MDIATKIKPASAAAPPPTITKKLFHCANIFFYSANCSSFLPGRKYNLVSGELSGADSANLLQNYAKLIQMDISLKKWVPKWHSYFT
jgi:hypothetical protein